MAEIRVITFDLDDTLWDVGKVIRNAEAEMRDWLGEHVPEFASRFDREALFELRVDLVRANPQLSHDVSALREAVLYKAIGICGYAPAEARLHARNAFNTFYEARQHVVFFDDALEVLDTLAGRYRLGALTNGNADIGKIGLTRYLSFAFSSADVGASKPAPDMFNAALRHCLVEPAQSIHVGDNLVDDISGAGEVGMHTVWTNHGGVPLPVPQANPPSETVMKLADLPDAVGSIQQAASVRSAPRL